MGDGIIDGVILTPLKIIATPGGDVLRAMKHSDNGYSGFGEAYFSTVEPSAIKGWKRHKEMTLNLVVPVGKIRFVVYDDRESSVSKNQFQEVILSRANYCRLTVPPMVWLGFQSQSTIVSYLLNIASIEHVPDESDKKLLDEISYDWE